MWSLVGLGAWGNMSQQCRCRVSRSWVLQKGWDKWYHASINPRMLDQLKMTELKQLAMLMNIDLDKPLCLGMYFGILHGCHRHRVIIFT